MLNKEKVSDCRNFRRLSGDYFVVHRNRVKSYPSCYQVASEDIYIVYQLLSTIVMKFIIVLH